MSGSNQDKANAVMQSTAPECGDLKNNYENCFNLWYTSKFLRGETSDGECKDLFEQYHACLKVCPCS